MKIFLAGATGAIGKRLVPLLVSAGHHITATTHTPDKVSALRAQGADSVVVDGLDKEGILKAITGSHPDVIVHQMTALASMRNLKKFDDEFAVTNRLRTEGTAYLLAAASAAGVRRFVAQSYAGWPNQRAGGRVKTEDDPLDHDPPAAMTKTLDAIKALESMLTSTIGVGGIVLRYGSFYGPGTSIGNGGDIVDMVRQRKFPLVGDAAGVWSFVHIDDAARATQLAIEGGTPGIYNIVDDEPAEVLVWLTELAKVIGAAPPRRIPIWLARLAIGDAGVSIMTKSRGASNAKAKRVLGWQPQFASWRDGFRRGL